VIAGLDHVALPLGNVEAMLAFYRGIGARVVEEVPGFLHAAYIGANKLNLHLPRAWQSARFTLRAAVARPGCADLCLVWTGSAEALKAMLAGLNVAIIEGPVARLGGRGENGESVYVRDPDENLIEFIIYPSTDNA
jgi:catechol 2,3-dioxygenase-like lactoylglutathione lyase family enzyme